MEKKIIVLVIILFVLTSAMLVIPLNKSSSSSNKLVKISENVFTFDGYTILHLNNSGKQIYVYDNNNTLIPLSLYHKFENQVNNFITVNPDISEFNYTIDSIQNFKTKSLSFYSSSYDYFTVAKAYQQTNLSNYYYILISGCYGGSNSGFQIPYSEISIFPVQNELISFSSDISYSNALNQTQFNGYTVKSYFLSGLTISPLNYLNIFSGITLDFNVNFNESGFYPVNIIFNGQGNITIKNSNNVTQLSSEITNKSVIDLQNGSYSYSFNYFSNNKTNYINGTFLINGNSVNLNFQQIILAKSSGLRFEIMITAFSILLILGFLVYYLFSSIIITSSLEFIGLFIGYEMKIEYFNFYSFIGIAILLLSLSIGYEYALRGNDNGN